MKNILREPQYPLRPIKILYLERTCGMALPLPAYKVRVDDNAEVKWNGLKNVDVEGFSLWGISRQKLNLLNALLTEYDFLNFEKAHDSVLMPLDGNCLVTVVFADGTRRKVCYGEYDEKFEEFAGLIDAILDTASRIKRPLMMC